MSRQAQPQSPSFLDEASRSPDEPRPEADEAVATWRQIEACLAPVIGKLGFSAMYLRCVALRSKSDPWLGEAHRGVIGSDDFAALHVALSRCTGDEAARAQRELLRAFHDLLVSLIGEPLTAKLLPASAKPRCAPPSSSNPPDDPTP